MPVINRPSIEIGRRSTTVPGFDAPDWHALTKAIARGDTQAFAVLYEEWFDRAFAVARSLTRRDEAFCLDVVQEAMLKAIRAMKPMPTRRDLDRWMTRLVHSAAIDMLRSESRRECRERRATIDRTLSPAATVQLNEQIELIRQSLRELPEPDRALLRHRFAGGRTLDEAGAIEAMTGDAAHGRIRRVLARLRTNTKEMLDE